MHVVRRGRAVWPEGKEPSSPYTIRGGDQLLIGATDPNYSFNMEVAADGTLKWQNQTTPVVGLTLDAAQTRIIETFQAKLAKAVNGGQMSEEAARTSLPPVASLYITIGGWREEADPEVVDRLEGDDQTRIERLERSLDELRKMIRDLKK